MPIDHLGATGWEMLGNDRAGDCVAVTWANVRRLVTSVAGAENYPSQDEVWAVYKTQNSDFDPSGDESTNGPGSSADGGMDIQTLLEYLVKHGGPDGVKALAFARVDPTNTEEVKAAIAIFGYVWTGIVVQDANMTQFNTGRPWDYVARSADDGGHSVITGGYGTPGKRARRRRAVHHLGAGDLVHRSVLVPEGGGGLGRHLARAPVASGVPPGVDLNALAADYQAITGKPFPAVIPPQPTPTPTPAPDVTAEQLATSIRGLLTQNGV